MCLFLELDHCFVGDRRRCRGAEQIHAHIRGPFQHDPRATGTRPIRPTIGLVAGTCDPGAGAAGAGCGRCEAANIQGTTRAGGHAHPLERRETRFVALARWSRKRYETSFTALERVGVLKAGATVNDLATVDWTALHATVAKSF